MWACFMAGQEDEKIRVQQGNDIVELIGEHVALKPQGREFVGLCPFHDDSRPSMQVSPAKQIFKCFACGAGGDVFSFVMNYHKLEFIEALKHLAERAGIELSRRSGEGQGGESSTRSRLSEANQQALSFFRKQLVDPEQGRAVRQYLSDRGISDEMIQQFQLGYAPDRWDALAQAAHHKRLDVPAFEQAGLIRQKRQGNGYIDRLRHRVIFPICDSLGRPIAFGGRRLRDEDEPKYLNSPETELFNKSATLYGLDLAKKPIIDSGTAVIVEGYTDVIACHQAGAANVIATLGTALTHEHVKQLRRYAEEVVLVFDPDEAGQKAADRAVEIFLTGEVDVAIAMLPQGMDPADLLSQDDGLDQWQRILNGSEDVLDHQFRRLENEMADARSITGRERLIDRFFEKLSQLGFRDVSEKRRNLILLQAEHLTGMSSRALRERLFNYLNNRNAVKKIGNANRGKLAEHPAENVDSSNKAPENAFFTKAEQIAHRVILGSIIEEPHLIDELDVDEEVAPEEMAGDERHLYEILQNRLEQGRVISASAISADLAQVGFNSLNKLLIKCQSHVEALVNSTTYSVKGLLRSHIDAVRAIRAHKDYLAEKMSFITKSRLGQASDEDVNRFLNYMVEFLNEHPHASRVLKEPEVQMSEDEAREFEQGLPKAMAG
jgi:DNA primase